MAFYDRFVALYLKPITRRRVLDLVLHLASQLGLSITLPSTQLLHFFDEKLWDPGEVEQGKQSPATQLVHFFDEKGEERLVPLEEFETIFSRTSSICIDFWWDDWEKEGASGIHVSDMEGGMGVLVSALLVWVPDDREEQVIQAFKEMFIALAHERLAWGLVIVRFRPDGEQPSEKPWDEILTGRLPLSPPYPDEILLPLDSPCRSSLDRQSLRISQPDPAVIEIRPKN